MGVELNNLKLNFPQGLTRQMLNNFYNSHKRHLKLLKNGFTNKSNAVKAELNKRQKIINDSGFKPALFVMYFHQYRREREANQRRRKNNY